MSEDFEYYMYRNTARRVSIKNNQISIRELTPGKGWTFCSVMYYPVSNHRLLEQLGYTKITKEEAFIALL